MQKESQVFQFWSERMRIEEEEEETGQNYIANACHKIIVE